MPEPSRRIPFLWLLAIAASAVIAYLPHVDCYFLKDDLALGLLADGSNPITWTGTVSWDAFIRHILWPTGQGHDQFWRPLPVLFAWFDLLIAGPDPSFFRIANIGFHALNGVLLAVFIHRLLNFRHAVAACLAATLWSLHPLHGEAVIWITQRMVVMSTTGTLLCLLGFQVWRSDKRRSALVVCGLGAFIAILSKETAATLPLMTAALAWCYPMATQSRIRAAASGGLAFAFIPVIVMGMRRIIFDTFGGSYANLAPLEYMRKFEVIERLPQSLMYGLVGANHGELTGDELTIAIVSTVVLALGCLLAILATWRASAVTRAVTLVGCVIAVASFLPTLPIFWISRELTNGRFLYQPLLGVVVVATAGLDGKHSRWVLLCMLIALPMFAVTGHGNRRAYIEADKQERAVILGLVETAHLDGRDPIIVAYGIPTEHRGVATLDLSVALATKPPFLKTPIQLIPLIEGQERDWPEQLSDRLALQRERSPDSPIVHVVMTRNPWGITPLYGAGDPPDGRPPEILAPDDGATLSCPGPAPVFVFTSVPKATRYLLHLEVPSQKVTFTIRPDVDAERFGTAFRWTFDRGDATGTPNAWALLSQGTFASPMAVGWRVEALNAAGLRVGISATRRLVVLQASG